MKAVVQRVAEARVTIDGEVVGSIGPGVAVLLGVGKADGSADTEWLANKIVGLRIFEDDEGKMNRGLEDVGGEALIVSQFTLWGDCRKGRRPSFIQAAPPEIAEPLYEEFVIKVENKGVKVATGKFGAMMQVHLINDGPVTLLLESPNNDQT